jgi:thymidylate synthase (FAD)
MALPVIIRPKLFLRLRQPPITVYYTPSVSVQAEFSVFGKFNRVIGDAHLKGWYGMLEELHKQPILDFGYLAYVEHWGSDERIVEAARMSTSKGFLGWEPGVCPICAGAKVLPCEENDGATSITCWGCEGKGSIPGDKNLIRRLWAKKHATPFEMAGLVVEVQAPIMVFREWHRHRTQSYNEMSARYIPLPNVNYVPSTHRLLLNATAGNKQAGTIKGAGELTAADAAEYRAELQKMWVAQQEFYEKWLSRGVPKELARTHIGVGRYSRMRACANLRNWLAFLTLRMSADAQWEIRQYACAVGNLIGNLYPRTWNLFVGETS